MRSARRKKTVEAKLVNGVLRVLIPDSLSAAEEARWVAAMQERMARKMRADRVDLPQRASQLAQSLALPQPRQVVFSDRQNTRWGSCTPADGRLRISNRVAAYPPWVLDYVIVHELAHLVEPNHSPAFWQLVDRYPLSERARGYLMAKDDESAG